MPKVFKTVFFIIASIIAFFFSTKNVIGAELFKDNFDNSSETLLKWVIIGPSLWQSVNNEFGVWIDSGVTNALPSDSYWDSSWQNFIYTVDLKGLDGTDKNVLIKFKDENNFYEIHHTDGYIYTLIRQLQARAITSPQRYFIH